MSEITVRQAIQKGLMEALDSDPDVFIMGEDIGAYGGAYAITSGFLENNFYGMGTSVDKIRNNGKSFGNLAENYGMPGTVVDGMDVLAVKEATEEAIKKIRSGSGPAFIEATTFRYQGHSMADPAKYRAEKELDEAVKFATESPEPDLDDIKNDIYA